MNDKTRAYYLPILLAISGLLSLIVLRPYLLTLALAAIFAVVLHPLYARIVRDTKGKVGLAALCTVLIASLCVLLPLAFIATRVFAQAQQVYGSLISGAGAPMIQASSARLGAWLQGIIPGSGSYVTSFTSHLSSYVQVALAWTFQNIGGIFTTVASMLLQLFIFLLALYYMLANSNRFREQAHAWSPLLESDTDTLMHKMENAITSIVRSRISTLLIHGAAAGIGFFIFGVPNALLWGLAAAVVSLVPNIGIWIAYVPAVLYLAVNGHASAAVGLSIWSIVMVLVIDNVVSPRLSGKGTQMNPLLTLLSIFGGLAAFGLSGLVLGPIILSLFFAVLTTYTASVSRRA